MNVLRTLFGASLLCFFLVTTSHAENVMTGLPVVPAGSRWSFWVQESAPADGWNAINFDDRFWRSAVAELGYGDGDERTVIREHPAPHPIAAYFRHTFIVWSTNTVATHVRLLRDDGAVVYLNGQEILRDNMPDGEIRHETLASTTVGGEEENGFRELTISPFPFVIGTNVLAVEVHQANAMSSDLSFDIELFAPIHIEGDYPLVSIHALWPGTSEPLPNALIAPGTFEVTRIERSLEQPLLVHIEYGGTASEADYEPLPSEVIIPAGTNEAQIIVLAKSDDLIEGTEILEAQIADWLPNPDPAPSDRPYMVNLLNFRAEVHIADEDQPPPSDLPIVSLVASRPETLEPPPNADVAPGIFLLRRTGSTAHELSVLLLYEGTATPDVDYPRLPESVTFPAGSSEVRIELYAAPDDLVEGTETVIANLIHPPTLAPIPMYWIDPEANSATIRILDDDSPRSATLSITTPENGAVFPAGRPVEITAVAIDPGGCIPRVEFFAGERLIGVSEIAFLVPPPDGTLITHTIEWNDPPVGEHLLFARATDSRGNTISSPRVRVRIGDFPPAATIEITHPDAGQEFPFGAPIPIEAVAIDPNGYIPRLEFFAGERRIGVSEITFIRAPDPGTPIHHSLDWSDAPAGEHTLTARGVDSAGQQVVSAPVRITVGSSLAPRVVITHPRDGGVFEPGQRIDIRAEAFVPEGRIVQLDLETTEFGSAAPWRLLWRTNTSLLAFAWTNAPPGRQVIRALASDDSGTSSQSAEVRVLVREASRAFVERQLPDNYSPGTPFLVRLSAHPPVGTRAWALEDQPPRGWTVTQISHDGVYDPATGKVKFGHFTDGAERLLSYSVRPPENASGEHEFTGTASADGHSYPIGGDRVIHGAASEHHPADSNRDNRIALVELTAYAAAWKSGPISPASIPLGHVTRAAMIWRRGETYHFESGLPAPFSWVPNAGQMLTFAEDRSSATRSGAEQIVPGAAAEVSINIQPAAGVSAYAIEEKVPAGWTATDMSDNGIFDAEGCLVRWGVFTDENTRTLRYTLNAPAEIASLGELRGILSCDGENQVIDGMARVLAADASAQMRIAEFAHRDDGRIQVKLTGAAGQVCLLEASSDLSTWTVVDEVFLPEGELEFVEDTGDGNYHRFYRLRIR